MAKHTHKKTRINPGMLGSGLLGHAGKVLQGRGMQIDAIVEMAAFGGESKKEKKKKKK